MCAEKMRALAGVLINVILCCLLFACGGAEDRREKYLNKAQTQFDVGDYIKARLEVKNALQIDPNHADARFLMGEIEAATKNWPQAFANYSKVLELSPEHQPARLKLSELYLLNGNLTKALEQAEAVLAREPEQLRATVLRAAVQLRQGDFVSAKQGLTAVLGREPTDEQARLVLASLYMQQQQPEQAVETLLIGLKHTPNDLPQTLMLADVYIKNNRPVEAVATLRRIIELEPKRAKPRLILVQYLEQLERFEQAEAELRQAIEQSPANEPLKLALVQFIARHEGEQQALQTLQAFIAKQTSQEYLLKFALAEVYERQHLTSRAQQTLESLFDHENPDVPLEARVKLAKLMFKQKQVAQAQDLLTQVLEESRNHTEALFLRSELKLQQSDADGAVSDLRLLLKQQPDALPAYKQLAKAYLLKQEKVLAKDVLKRALSFAPHDSQTSLLLAQIESGQGQLQTAMNTLKKGLNHNPDDKHLIKAALQVAVVDKNFKQAHGLVERFKNLAMTDTDTAEASLMQATILHAQGDVSAAIKAYQAALVHMPTSIPVLKPFAKLLVREQQMQQAEQLLQQALAKAPNDAALHNLQAEVFMALKRFNQAIVSLEQAIKLKPQWATPYGNLGLCYESQKKPSEAIVAYQRGLNSTEDKHLGFRMALLHQQQQQYDAAIAAYERLVTRYPDFDVAANNLAMLLADAKRSNPSSADLMRAKELVVRLAASDLPMFQDTAAWVYYRLGELDQALSLLSRAAEQLKDEPSVHYHLGVVQHAKGDLVAAKTQLSKALAVGGLSAMNAEHAHQLLEQMQKI